MLNIKNILENDTKRNAIANIISSILQCKDGAQVEEIYAKTGSFKKDGTLGAWVNLVICLSQEFCNHDLYDLLNDLEDSVDFTLILSTETNTVERGHGIVLWER